MSNKVHIYSKEETGRGLKAICFNNGIQVQQHVSLDTAERILSIAIASADNPQFFPSGYWATIQRIQSGICYYKTNHRNGDKNEPQ